jgi:Beta-L-arabinofuranosidase, GH127
MRLPDWPRRAWMMPTSDVTVRVPDTLDLAARAGLAINGLLGSLDPEADYEPYFLAFFMANPPYLLHWSSLYSGVLPKYLEALPLLRVASGNPDGADVERAMLDAVAKNIEHDGLIYDEERPDRPWNSGIGYGKRSWREDYANLAGNGRLIIGFSHYYQLTGDELWLNRARRTAGRMMDLAITKADYAYYPNVGLGNDFSYPKQSGWVHTREPSDEKEGSEGAVLFYQSQPIRGLVRYHNWTGDERALDVAERLTRFVLRPRFWGGYNDLDPEIGAARGHFWGHFHGHTATLRALLDYAVAANDWHVKSFVRDAYEHARHHAAPELGLFGGEGCTAGDIVALAIQLTDAGVGDYWDDVDHYLRNGLIEFQIVDAAELERMRAVSPVREKGSPWGAATEWRFEAGIQRSSLPGQESTDRVIERMIGSFGHVENVYFQRPMMMACCIGNGSQGLYYGWEAIARCSGDHAQVNLLLNRRSQAIDVESSLPYMGQVTFRNKNARRLSVRIPGWAEPGAVRFEVDGTATSPELVGRYATFGDLRPGQVIQMSFPLATRTRTVPLGRLNGRGTHVERRFVDVQFRGSTVVRVGRPEESLQGRELDWYRLYRREDLERQQDDVPTVPGNGYVADRTIDPW